jgi:tRNA(Ile)-lysidine synthase
MAELRPSVTDIPYRTIDLAHHVGMDKETGAEATLPGGIKLRLDYEHLLIATDLEQIPVSQPQLPRGKPQTLLIPGSVTLDGDWLLTAAESDINPAAVRENPDPWLAYLDIGQEAALQVRPRIPGEHIQSLGMGGRSASVQDVMVNRKVPAGLRDCWPIVATDDHPLWLVGLHIDERAKVTEHTWRIIKLSCYQVGDLKTGFE